MRKYCVIARFDEYIDCVFSEWKQKSHEMQKTFFADKQWPPHMTLAAYEGIDEAVLCEWTEQYVNRTPQIPIQFNSLGVYAHAQSFDTDVIYVNPCSSLPLVNFYYGYHQKLDEYCGTLGYEYSATCGTPVFHSTITICNKNDFNHIFDYFRENFTVTSGRIVALEVYELPMKFISRYELKHD